MIIEAGLRGDRDPIGNRKRLPSRRNDRRVHQRGPRLPGNHETPIAARGHEQVVHPVRHRSGGFGERQDRYLYGRRRGVMADSSGFLPK